jgi:dolichol-phosphate mannosyltransferase
MKKISIITPVYNEGSNVLLAYEALKEVFAPLKNYQYEFVFVEDGSRDNSFEYMEELAKKDPNVKAIQFSRNFGKEIAVTAGINKCTGDACILFDCDLQYPVEVIPQFIKEWEEGNEVVIGIRDKKKEKSLISKYGSKGYNKIMKKISDIEIIEGAIDFRLLDRKVINEFNKMSETNRITRGLIDWLGFKRAYLPYVEKERVAGEATISLKKRIKLALNSFISHSYFPLKLAGYLGILITLLSLAVSLFILVQNYILGDPLKLGISGAALLAVMNLFMTGIMLMSLGLIALYIANIHEEVNDRPIYVVRQEKN